jgi:hypothetical protein
VQTVSDCFTFTSQPTLTVKRVMRTYCVHLVVAREAHALRSVLDLAWEPLEEASAVKALVRESLVDEAC